MGASRQSSGQEHLSECGRSVGRVLPGQHFTYHEGFWLWRATVFCRLVERARGKQKSFTLISVKPWNEWKWMKRKEDSKMWRGTSRITYSIYKVNTLKYVTNWNLRLIRKKSTPEGSQHNKNTKYKKEGGREGLKLRSKKETTECVSLL